MNLKIFYPITQLTTNEQTLSATPAKRFFPHITIPSVVEVIKTHDNITEVQFPTLDKTDIVSVDFLHSVDSPEVSILTKMVRSMKSERSNERCQDD